MPPRDEFVKRLTAEHVGFPGGPDDQEEDAADCNPDTDSYSWVDSRRGKGQADREGYEPSECGEHKVPARRNARSHPRLFEPDVGDQVAAGCTGYEHRSAGVRGFDEIAVSAATSDKCVDEYGSATPRVGRGSQAADQ